MQKWLRAALKLANNQSTPDTCSAHKFSYFLRSLFLVEFNYCRSRLKKKVNALWDANRELVAVNPRVTDQSSNRVSNNATLTPS